MKKSIMLSVLSCLVAFGVSSCNKPVEPPAPVEETANFEVTIGNKESLLSRELAKGDFISVDVRANPQLPQEEIQRLINKGLIKITSSDTAVAVVTGRNVNFKNAGNIKITVTCGDYSDSIDLSILSAHTLKTEPERVAMPENGGRYKIGFAQLNVATPAMYYLKTKDMQGSYYWLTTQSLEQSLTVTVEEIPGATDDYKYYLKVSELGEYWYIGLGYSSQSNGDHINDTTELTPTTKWKWDAEHKTFLTYFATPSEYPNFTKKAGDYFLGTNSTNTTFSLAHVANIENNVTYMIAHLYNYDKVLSVPETNISIVKGLTTDAKIYFEDSQGDVTMTVTSGSDVISVNNDGSITALSAGTATVTVTDGVTSVTVTVTVRDIAPGDTKDNPMTPAQAIVECAKLDASKNEISKFKYYIEGVVIDNPSADYCNFNYSDGTSSIKVYGLEVMDPDSTDRYGTNREVSEIPFKKGATVKVYGNFQNYGGTLEIANAKLISFTNPAD